MLPIILWKHVSTKKRVNVLMSVHRTNPTGPFVLDFFFFFGVNEVIDGTNVKPQIINRSVCYTELTKW